jgi:uncharacterized protein (DUF1330 family)
MKKTTALGWMIFTAALCLAGCAQDAGSDGDSAGAYVVANFRITDAEGYSAYPPLARPMLAAHGAEVLAVDRDSEVLEGRAGHNTVVIRFPSKEVARAFYDSPEYREIVGLRTNNSEGFMVLIEGVAAPE